MKLLVVVPGIGDDHFYEKKEFLIKNTKIIKETFSGSVDFLIFNYSDNNFDGINGIKIIKEQGIIGQFIYKNLNPSTLEKYDYIILMLDDIEISNNLNVDDMIKIYHEHGLNIISPSLTKDSKYSHNGFMLENDQFIEKIRIVNFCEYFFYLMDLKSFTKYWQIFDEKTYWLWGIDLCLHLQGFKMGIINDFKVKHYYISESYKKNLPNPNIEMIEKEIRFGKINNMKNESTIPINLLTKNII